MKDIIIVGNSREGAVRCPKKMVRNFGDTTVFDLYIKRLIELRDRSGYKVILALHKSDENLVNIANKYDIDIVYRNDDSIKNNLTLKQLHHFMEDYDNKYMMWINASFPFLKVDTLLDIIDYFNSHDGNGLHCIKKVDNWFWKDGEYKPINVSNVEKIKSQDVDNIYESVQCLHIFDRKFILDNNKCWTYTKNDPLLYKVKDSIEFLDIDTEKDFFICESVYNNINKND